MASTIDNQRSTPSRMFDRVLRTVGMIARGPFASRWRYDTHAPSNIPIGIKLRCGDLIISSAGPLCWEGRVTEVANIDDLVQIAERVGSMIVHEQLDGCHRFSVPLDGCAYRFHSR